LLPDFPKNIHAAPTLTIEEPDVSRAFGTQGAVRTGSFRVSGVSLNRNRPQDERRKSPRLPLAIPIFVRSRDKSGKDLLEFATALNISATGALLAVRRSLPLSSQVLLEIPSVPLASTTDLPKSCRNLRAKTMWIAHAETYQLVGLRFSHPLLNHDSPRASIRRKVLSTV
jgi:PilZ domain